MLRILWIALAFALPWRPALAQIGASLDLTGARSTFSAIFNTVPLLRRGAIPTAAQALGAPGFEWLAGGLHATSVTAGSTATWATQPNALEAYPNGDAIAAGAPNPFSAEFGGLAITARPLTAAEQAALPPGVTASYVSGALSSYPFAQTYGYFEMTAQLPRGQGLWPAFWMLPVDDTWPPEIDVVETLGQTPTNDLTSLHTADPAFPRDFTAGNTVADTSTAFHSYGVDWGPQTITFYFDRHALLSRPTPSDMHKPFYVTFNLAVGGPGSWPGPPNATTVFPATMVVSAVRVWQRNKY